MSNASLFPGGNFQISYGNVVMHFERVPVGSTETYRIVFNTSRLPLVITRARAEDGSWFWTSIPEGRQPEAEGIGKLLEEHVKKL